MPGSVVPGSVVLVAVLAFPTRLELAAALFDDLDHTEGFGRLAPLWSEDRRGVDAPRPRVERDVVSEDRDTRPRRRAGRADAADTLPIAAPPLVVVAGTCMSAGKTYACGALIQELTHRGLRVHAGKVTGVSLRRDVLQMEDAGARRTVSFTDLGVVTTTSETAPWSRRLSSRTPQVRCLAALE